MGMVAVMKDGAGWWTVTDKVSFTGTVSLNQVKPSNHLNFFSFPLADLRSKHEKYSRIKTASAVSLLRPTNSIYLSTNETQVRYRNINV